MLARGAELSSVFPSFPICALTMRGYVVVEVALRDGPTFPVIKVKQKRCRQNNSAGDYGSLPTASLDKNYFILQLTQTTRWRNKLMLYHRITIKPFHRKFNVTIVRL